MAGLAYKGWGETTDEKLVEHVVELDETDRQLSEFNRMFLELKGQFSGERNREAVVGLLDRMKELALRFTSFDSGFVVQSEIVQTLHSLAGREEDLKIRDGLLAVLFYVVVRSAHAVNILLEQDPGQMIQTLLTSGVESSMRIGCYLLKRIGTFESGCVYCYEKNIYDFVVAKVKELLSSPAPPTRESLEILNALLLTLYLLLEYYPAPNMEAAVAECIGIADRALQVASLRSSAIRILIRLCCKHQSVPVVASGLFDRSMGMFNEPEAPLGEIVLLASQVLFDMPEENREEIAQKIPVQHMLSVMATTQNMNLMHGLLTLFINLISVSDEFAGQILSIDNIIERLLEYGNQTGQDAQIGVWLIWSLLKASPWDVISRIIADDLVYDALILGLESENSEFINSGVIPALVAINRKFMQAGQASDPNFVKLKDGIEPKMTDLCYAEMDPHLQSMAASCLADVFPEAYKRENFT